MAEEIVIRIVVDPASTAATGTGTASANAATVNSAAAREATAREITASDCRTGTHYDETLKACVNDKPADGCPPGFMQTAANDGCLGVPLTTCPPGSLYSEQARGCVAAPKRKPQRPGHGHHRPPFGGYPNYPHYPAFPNYPVRCPAGFHYDPRWHACLPAGVGSPGYGTPGWGGGWGYGDEWGSWGRPGCGGGNHRPGYGWNGYGAEEWGDDYTGW
ncbi:MAG: hypothetical protein LBS72_09580 [Oscillospiraceae bacterium]|nr:hypothetical protein [Oscillospiraceae bacterium]